MQSYIIASNCDFNLTNKLDINQDFKPLLELEQLIDQFNQYVDPSLFYDFLRLSKFNNSNQIS